MKIKLKFCMLLALLPCLMFGQVNKYISFGKKYVPAFNREINSVKVLCNDSLYNAKMKQYNSEKGGEQTIYGYYEFVYLDFFKKASKFKTPDGICYALHFELEKGENLEFDADTFNIPWGTYLVLSDTLGNEIENFGSKTKVHQFPDGKKFVYIGNPLRPAKSIILSFTLQDGIPLENIKITFFDICINIIKIFVKENNKSNIKSTVANSRSLKNKGLTNICNFNVPCMGNSGQQINKINFT